LIQISGWVSDVLIGGGVITLFLQNKNTPRTLKAKQHISTTTATGIPIFNPRCVDFGDSDADVDFNVNPEFGIMDPVKEIGREEEGGNDREIEEEGGAVSDFESEVVIEDDGEGEKVSINNPETTAPLIPTIYTVWLIAVT